MQGQPEVHFIPNNWWREIPLHSSPGPQRPPVRWAVLGAGFLLPFVIPTVRQVLESDGPVLPRVLTLLLVAVYSLCYVVFPMILHHESLTLKLAFCLGMLGVGLLLLTLISLDAVFLLTYSMAIIALALPAGWALLIDGGTFAGLTLTMWIAGDLPAGFDGLGTAFSVVVAMFFMGRLVRAIRGLRQANEEIATLAVTAERERLARDLHDILGHSLTTITVKAGLARRMLESRADPDETIEQIRELEGLSRGALSDIRATVSQYREVSLPAELAGAAEALRAAQIEADFPYAVDNVRPDLRSAFGYVLREGVTNVIRHSGARQVTLRLGRTWLELADDGIAGDTVRAGNGLRGLAERLAEVGATLRTSVRPGGGLLLRAEAGLAAQPEPEGTDRARVGEQA